jgi:SAM-dependent methyltransferase
MDLSKGASALDVGCGPGIDTVKIAAIVGPSGRVVGVDADPAMVRFANIAAAENGVTNCVEHIVASGGRLPFDDTSFHSVRCERVLQHLSPSDAAALVKEAFRVTRNGGRCVFLDTEWPSLSIHSNDIALERTLVLLRTNLWRNGYAARAMAEHLVREGLEVGAPRTFNLDLGYLETQFFLGPAARTAIALGQCSTLRVQAWWNELSTANAKGCFYASVNLIVWTGKKSA